VSVFLATVCASVDTSKRVGDRDHLKLFATEDAANEWFRDNDPEGVAFEYPIIGQPLQVMPLSGIE
jgi:hypothetical protein